MKNWTIEGNFVKSKNRRFPDRKIQFIHKNNGSFFTLIEYTTEHFTLIFFPLSPTLFEHFQSKLHCFRPVNEDGQPYIQEMVENSRGFDRYDMNKAIDLYLNHALIDEELAKKMRDLIGINKKENEIYESCRRLIKEDIFFNLPHAIRFAENAQKAGHYKIIFQLAEDLWDFYQKKYPNPQKLSKNAENNFKCLINLYEKINKKNPRYKNARQRINQIKRCYLITVELNRFFDQNVQKNMIESKNHSWSYSPL